MKFEYWCPECEKTIVREGFRIRRKSCCVSRGDKEVFLYLKGSAWILLILWLILALGVGMLMTASGCGLVDPVIGG